MSEDVLLERYLNAATRGLWGQSRAAVREELHAHLLEQIRRYQVGGLSRADAAARTCLEMGSPGRTALGFIGVHSMSKLLLITTFVLIGGGGGVFWVTQQIAMSDEAPRAPWGSTSFCGTVESSTPPSKLKFCAPDVPGIPFNALIQQFKAAGFPARKVVSKDFSSKAYEHIEVKFPNLRTTQIPFATPGRRDSPELYAGSWELVSKLSNSSGQDFTLEGWTKPVLNIGGKQVFLESSRSEAIAYNLYAKRAFDHTIPTIKGRKGQKLLLRLAHPSYPDKTLEGTEKRTISVEVADGTVLAAFSRAENGGLVLDVAPVSNNHLKVYLARGAIKPVSNKQFGETDAQAFFVVPIQTHFRAPEKSYKVPDALEVKLLEQSL